MRKKILLLSLTIVIFLSGCSLTDKPKIAYTVSNTTTSQKVIDNEVEELQESGAIALWKPSLSSEIQTEKDANKAAVAGYVKLRMSLDEVEIIVKDQKIDLTDADKKNANKIMKFDFGIANVGASEPAVTFDKIPKNVKKLLLKKYEYKAAYMRAHAAKKVSTESIQTSIDQIAQNCSTSKALYVISFDSKNKDAIAKDLAEGNSFKELSDKYNLNSVTAIQNGFYDCYETSYFEENISSQLNDDANLNKILGPFEISNENLYFMVKPMSEVKATELNNLIDYTQLNESGVKLDTKLAKTFQETPPTLNKKYGYIEVTENGLNVKIDKKYLTNTSSTANSQTTT